ncbi:alpha/beta hydrolase [Fredinandcohnia humi]
MKYYQVSVNGRKLQILDTPGEKGTILAIHGLTGNHKNLEFYRRALAGQYRFISIDLRGRGNSSETDPTTSIEQHADDVIGLIETLQIKSPILLGYSMGAYITAVVASVLKDTKALILLDGAAKASDHQRQIIAPSLGRLSKKFETMESYVNEVKEIYTRLGVEWNEVVRESVEYEIKPWDGYWKHKSDEEQIVKDFESFYSFDPKMICSQIECKTLLVICKGKIGPFPPLFLEQDYALTKQFTRSLTSMTSTSNHYTLVFHNQPEINKAILEFLEGEWRDSFEGFQK